jgi:Cd(II)/Pb(II)-responsive transcriptional regulator
MKIGELAARAGCDVQTVRFYEREGILPEPEREASGYRRYGEQHVQRLLFVRHCRSLDMSLSEVRVLLRFMDAPEEGCGEVNQVLDEHIGHVSRRIRELRLLEKQLKALRQRCGAERTADQCGILAGLSEAAQEPAAPAAGRNHLPSVHGH